MKYVDEYRAGDPVKSYADLIRARVTRPWTIMEICGGQTHSIVKHGLDQLLPPEVTLVHGPGCPVCVTPITVIDQALAIAARPEVIFCSFGDMLRVPGTDQNLLMVKAAGGDVRIVYSPLDAVEIAAQNPDKQVVFFAVGFETTTPLNGLAAKHAKQRGLKNFSLLVSQVRVPPAISAILGSPDNQVQGFLAAGHVCTIMGIDEYPALVEEFKVPLVVTGFEPLDIMQGLYHCIVQLEEGRAELEVQYTRSVKPGGNPAAQAVINEVFEVVDKEWRGLETIPQSGFGIAPDYAEFDALKRFGDLQLPTLKPNECIAGLILQGAKKPDQCPAFGKRCTPEHPLGATMVSSEGACAAYYSYRRAPELAS